MFFAIDFETGDTSQARDTGGEAAVVVSGVSAYEGSFGGSAVDQTANVYIGDGPATYDLTTAYYRVYNRFPALPNTGSLSIIRVVNTSGSAIGFVRMRSDGRISLHQGNQSQLAISTTVIAADAWYRLELDFTRGTTSGNGAASLRIFTDPTSNTPAETIGTTTANFGNVNQAQCGFGTIAEFDSAATYTMHWDRIEVSDAPLPPVDSPSAPRLFIADIVPSNFIVRAFV